MKADFSPFAVREHCQRWTLRSRCVLTSRAGFTLVEMLVVLAIIALLAGLLLPQFIGSKERMRRIVCGNNLRQIHTAIVAYMKDYDDVFPFYDIGNGGQKVRNAPVLLDEKLNVLIPRFVKNPKIFQCPSRLAMGLGEKELKYHYQYNPNLSFSGNGGGKPPRALKGAQIRNPSALRLLWDSVEQSKNGSCDASCNHGADGGNVMYFDGHLKWISGAAFRVNEEVDPDLLVKQ